MCLGKVYPKPHQCDLGLGEAETLAVVVHTDVAVVVAPQHAGIFPDAVQLVSSDIGPGIPDLEMAMREGYSTANDEARSLGFGAGMGLPNMKRNADEFDITSAPGSGTTITMLFRLQS